MLNFNQFVNENKNNEFDSIEKNDIVNLAGTRYTVKKVGDGVIVVKGRDKDIKINKGMWNQRGGRLIEKEKKEDDK